MTPRPCRCLAGEIPGGEKLAAVIRERIESLAETERVPETAYARRLDRCRTCEHLQRGTCGLCGCYAEIRAARRWQQCPDVPPRWTAENGDGVPQS